MDRLFVREALKGFLAEDIGTGDITSESIFDQEHQGEAKFVAKDNFIAVGFNSIAAQVFSLVNPMISCQGVTDGQKVSVGETIFTAQGATLDLLKGERVALNLVQRLCGIATLTADFISQVADFDTKIVDTRKTTPGLRVMEKYAVRIGGGNNHRFSLSDGVLIKDNHIAASGSIHKAVEKVRNRAPHTIKIEVEAESLIQVEECLACAVDAILLDNMTIKELKQSVALAKGKSLLEASGGINLNTVYAVAATGVDLISIGALTHSAPASDISMRLTAS